MLVHDKMVLRGLVYTIWNEHGMGYVICWWYGIWAYGKTTVCGMVCIYGVGRENHSIWYGAFAVWDNSTISWMYSMATFAWWYGMCQYIKSVTVEYVVRISSVTSLYIGRWKVFKNFTSCGPTDWRTCRQTDRQTDI